MTPPETTHPSSAAKYPDWTSAAKIVGDKDWVGYMGGHVAAGEPLICMLHHRAARIVGHPQLPYRARVVVTFAEPFSPAGPTDEHWKQIDQVINSAERRIVQRKLGLLVLMVVHERSCEVLLHCKEHDATLAALEAARDRAAAGTSVDISVHEDPKWEAFHAIWSAHGAADVGIGPTAAPVMKELSPAHPAVASEELFRKWLRKHPPRCIAGLRLTWMMKLDPRSRVTVGFRLADKKGGDVARVHAHRLADVDPAYAGGGDELLSPIHLTWKKSNDSVQIFDAAADGYQGEFRWNSQPRGSGVGPAVTCKRCGGDWFRVAAIFDYHDAAFDLGRDQAAVAIQNYFAAATFRCTCVACGQTIDV